MTTARAVFVDRDGVINELIADPVSGRPESPLRVADVRLIDGAAVALQELSHAGWLLVGVSNQPAAAKGRVSLDEIMAVHGRVMTLLEAQGVHFDRFELCPHHPDGTVGELTAVCDCRKPAPGMLLAAAEEFGIDLMRSWMIGDTDNDIQAGQRAGCRTVLVANTGSAHKRAGAAAPTATVPNLVAAAALILGKEGVTSPP